MDFSDEIHVSAPIDVVFAGLRDPDILKKSIPGCQSLVALSENDLEALVVLKIGPVKAKFKGNVTLETSLGPKNFSLKGAGTGGVAGFVKGGADVTLEQLDTGTLLRYLAKVEMGGKIAQLGNRLILGTAKKLSKQFFSNFSNQVIENS